MDRKGIKMTYLIFSYCEAQARVRQGKAQRQLRYIEWMGVKIYDFQKITISTLSKLYNAGLGVLISKRYHMWG